VRDSCEASPTHTRASMRGNQARNSSRAAPARLLCLHSRTPRMQRHRVGDRVRGVGHLRRAHDPGHGPPQHVRLESERGPERRHHRGCVGSDKQFAAATHARGCQPTVVPPSSLTARVSVPVTPSFHGCSQPRCPSRARPAHRQG